MKTSTLLAIISLAILSALPWSQAVHAGNGLQRCQDMDGNISYTDRGCAALGRQAAAMPGELLIRIANEQSKEPEKLYEEAFPGTAGHVGNPGRRSPLGGCARSKQQLLADLEGAFALGNVNRLAESYHWVGKSNRQAQQQMLQLERMADEGLMQAALFDAQSNPMPGDASTATLQLSLGRTSVQQVVDLGVLRYSGCYFARI